MSLFDQIQEYRAQGGFNTGPTPVPTPTPKPVANPAQKAPSLIDKIANAPIPIPGIPQQFSPTLSGVGNVIKDTGQSILRSAASVSKTIPGSTFNSPQVQAGLKTPLGKTISNAAFGPGEIKSLPQQIKEGKTIPFVDKKVTGLAAAPLVLGETALNLTPMAGGGEKKVAEEALSLVNKAVDAGDFAKLFERATPEVKALIQKGIQDKKVPFNSVEDFYNFAKNPGRNLLGPGDPEARLRDALTANKKYTAQQQEIYKTEGGQRIQQAGEAFQSTGGGEAGLNAAKKKLGGAYSQVDTATNDFIKQQLSQSDVDALINKIHSTTRLNDFEKIAASDALAKLVNEGRRLRPAEIEKLSQVFSPETMNVLQDVTPVTGMSRLTQLGTLPRSLKSTLDFSAPLRQGLPLLVPHPKDFARAFKNMFGYAFSENKFNNFKQALMDRPTYAKMREAKVMFTDFGDVTTREEAFMSNLAEKIPVIGRFVRGSDRAYTGFLNNLRGDVFDTIYKGLSDAEKNDPKILQDIGKFINTATGRGDFATALSFPDKLGGKQLAEFGGKINQAAPLLNTIFFAPRLIASRLTMLNPFYYAKLSGPARKEATKSAVGTVVMGLTILGAAKLAGAEVGTDPTSADFGKIKVGNGTRYDIWGGFQQYATLISRMLLNKSTNSDTGRVTEFGQGYKPTTRGSILLRFGRSKLAPIPGAMVDFATGTDINGQQATIPHEAGQALAPFTISDLYDTVRTYGPLGPIVSTPGLFGVGAQTYNDITNQNSPSAPTVKTRSIGTKINPTIKIR